MATIFTSNYSGDYGYLYEFKAEAWESDVNNSANTSKVNVDIYLRRTNVSSNGAYNNNGTGWSITIDGTAYSGSSTWDTRNSNEWKWIGNASKIITHEESGQKTVSISASHTGNSASGSSKMGNASGNGILTLTTIPRYTTVNNSLRSKTLNSISINWNTADARDHTQYSLNNGSWQDAYDTVASDQKSGYYTISNLSPNTTYTIKTRCKRTDSQLWSEASSLNVSTYDIAKITNLPDLEHGNNITVDITNPAGVALDLEMKIGDTKILTRTVTTGENTIEFSDTELDTLYKEYRSSNSVTATVIVSGSGYTNSKTCTITLKGNHKTIMLNISSVWKRGKLWINIASINKKAVIWRNIDGTWKRGG